MKLLIWSAWLMVSLAGTGCRGAGAPRFVRGVRATPLLRVPIELAPGEKLEIEAVEPHGDALPVLHLWEPSNAHELARAAAGRLWHHNPRLHYSNESRSQRRLELLVRSDRPHASGRVDVLRNGKPLLRAARFGGALLELAAASDPWARRRSSAQLRAALYAVTFVPDER